MRECSAPQTCHISRFRCHVSRVTCHMSCVMCHVSHVTCHMSHVMCHVSCVTCQLLLKKINKIKMEKVVTLVGGGSDINGATPSSLTVKSTSVYLDQIPCPFIISHISHQVHKRFRQRGQATSWLNQPPGPVISIY